MWQGGYRATRAGDVNVAQLPLIDVTWQFPKHFPKTEQNKMIRKYIINRSDMIALACDCAVTGAWLNNKERRCFWISIFAGAAEFVADRCGAEPFLAVKFNETINGVKHNADMFAGLFGSLIVAVLFAFFIYWVLYDGPRRCILKKARAFIEEEESDGAKEFELKIDVESIANSQKRSSQTIFFNEVDQLICGKVGYHFVASANKRIKMSIHNSAIDCATLQSLLPPHIRCRVKPEGFSRLLKSPT